MRTDTSVIGEVSSSYPSGEETIIIFPLGVSCSKIPGVKISVEVAIGSVEELVSEKLFSVEVEVEIISEDVELEDVSEIKSSIEFTAVLVVVATESVGVEIDSADVKTKFDSVGVAEVEAESSVVEVKVKLEVDSVGVEVEIKIESSVVGVEVDSVDVTKSSADKFASSIEVASSVDSS